MGTLLKSNSTNRLVSNRWLNRSLPATMPRCLHMGRQALAKPTPWRDISIHQMNKAILNQFLIRQVTSSTVLYSDAHEM